MKLPIFQVDAFCQGPFSGNPAAVCPLKEWLPDKTLQAIAEENNLSETAFFVKESDRYHIRWFTPNTEVNLCGHATLASAFVIFNELDHNGDIIEMDCLSGRISVTKHESELTLDFPIDEIKNVECSEDIIEALGETRPIEVFKGKSDYLLVYNHEYEITNMNPNFDFLKKIDARGFLVTSKGKDYDIVYRGFFPRTAVNEDPATGSAQTTLSAYWTDKLDLLSYNSCQLSSRKGYFSTKRIQNRVHISGKCQLFLKGDIFI